MEKAEGNAVPAFRNDGKLPMIIWPKVMNENTKKTIKFKLDVTGVDKLYIGASARNYINKIVLGKGDGVEASLNSKKGESVEIKTSKNLKKVKGNNIIFYNPGEAVLELGGHYKWISGEVDQTSGVCWIDRSSRAEKYTKAYKTRRDVCGKSGFDDKLYSSMLPSGYSPVNLQMAGRLFLRFQRSRRT
jgi:hypothetical protein